MPLTIVKPEDLTTFVGKSLEPSSWLLIDQDRINAFADATNDHQFIHVDPEKAEPVFGSTIAHGFLTLSLTSGLGEENALVVEGSKMSLNYGLDKIRFLAPVPVNSKIRMHSKILEVKEKNPGQYLIKSEVTMELEGSEKPAFIAEQLGLWVT